MKVLIEGWTVKETTGQLHFHYLMPSVKSNNIDHPKAARTYISLDKAKFSEIEGRSTYKSAGAVEAPSVAPIWKLPWALGSAHHGRF